MYFGSCIFLFTLYFFHLSCKQIKLRHPRSFQPACFSYQTRQRIQYCHRLLYPPSAYAIEFHQKQSASGFMFYAVFLRTIDRYRQNQVCLHINSGLGI